MACQITELGEPGKKNSNKLSGIMRYIFASQRTPWELLEHDLFGRQVAKQQAVMLWRPVDVTSVPRCRDKRTRLVPRLSLRTYRTTLSRYVFFGDRAKGITLWSSKNTSQPVKKRFYSCVGKESTWSKSGLSLTRLSFPHSVYFLLEELRSLATWFLQRDIPNPLIRMTW